MSSKATKTRYVTGRLNNEFILPSENELIGKVIAARGRDLFEVIDEDGKQYLASMPTRFRTTVYVKRDQYVYLLPIDEGQKVKAEITHVLDDETIIYACEQNLWPERFKDETALLMKQSKRTADSNTGIDHDMLPPSGSDTDSDINSGDDENVSDEDDEIEESSVYNPNRVC